MIKNIIYVEDGSIDVDLLEEELGNDTRVIVYRQGSTPPEIIHLKEPINTQYDEYESQVKLNIPEVKQLFRDLYEMKKSKKVNKKCTEIYETLFGEIFLFKE